MKQPKSIYLVVLAVQAVFGHEYSQPDLWPAARGYVVPAPAAHPRYPNPRYPNPCDCLASHAYIPQYELSRCEFLLLDRILAQLRRLEDKQAKNSDAPQHKPTNYPEYRPARYYEPQQYNEHRGRRQVAAVGFASAYFLPKIWRRILESIHDGRRDRKP